LLLLALLLGCGHTSGLHQLLLLLVPGILVLLALSLCQDLHCNSIHVVVLPGLPGLNTYQGKAPTQLQQQIQAHTCLVKTYPRCRAVSAPHVADMKLQGHAQLV
jgi:hypothetical protein